MKFPPVTVMKNLLHMFTVSVGIAAERQCTGVRNSAIGGKLVFLPRVPSPRTNHFVVRRTWIFRRKVASGMSYQVLQDLLQIVGQEVTLRILATVLLTP